MQNWTICQILNEKIYKLAELSVFPAGKAITFANRKDNQYIYTFNLVIRCPVAPAKEPDISSEMYFAEEVIESLDRVQMSNAVFVVLKRPLCTIWSYLTNATNISLCFH